MKNYSWPGNVRELENELARMVVFSGACEEISEKLLSGKIRQGHPVIEKTSRFITTLPIAIEALERRMLLESLEKSGWNKTRSAKDLGISRRNLIRKVKKYHFSPEMSSSFAKK